MRLERAGVATNAQPALRGDSDRDALLECVRSTANSSSTGRSANIFLSQITSGGVLMAGRNLVLCLDGTSNRYKKDNTNVIKLFAMLDRNRVDQRMYYQPGVGTITP